MQEITYNYKEIKPEAADRIIDCFQHGSYDTVKFEARKDGKCSVTFASFYENMQEHLNISFKEIGKIAEYGFNNAGKKLTFKDFECYDPCLLDTEENETLKEVFKDFSSMINKL